jgi:hypothetical protein
MQTELRRGDCWIIDGKADDCGKLHDNKEPLCARVSMSGLLAGSNEACTGIPRCNRFEGGVREIWTANKHMAGMRMLLFLVNRKPQCGRGLVAKVKK